MIKYVKNEKSGITDSINHNFEKLELIHIFFLPIEKMLTFYKVLIVIKSVVNKNEITTTLIHF